VYFGLALSIVNTKILDKMNDQNEGPTIQLKRKRILQCAIPSCQFDLGLPAEEAGLIGRVLKPQSVKLLEVLHQMRI